MKVPYVSLGISDLEQRQAMLDATERVLESGQFILGQEVERFEKRIALLCGVKHAIGVANGTDAIMLALKAVGIGPGDEVITAPNSFLASASSIALIGATPVFVDVDRDYNINPELLEAAITPKTKAVLPVHLTGRPAKMDDILEIGEKHRIAVIEDAAQAIGASLSGRPVGSLGRLGCFSLHPLKVLAACGDGGVITTNDDDLNSYLRVARNHGLKNRDEVSFWSINSRLDAIHAAQLNVKLDAFESVIARRVEIARIYQNAFEEKGLTSEVTWPVDRAEEASVYHLFMIAAQKRDALQNFLHENGVESKIHYPIPIHLQEAAASLGYSQGDFPVTEELASQILSLPIYPELDNAQVEGVVSLISNFYRS